MGRGKTLVSNLTLCDSPHGLLSGYFYTIYILPWFILFDWRILHRLSSFMYKILIEIAA